MRRVGSERRDRFRERERRHFVVFRREQPRAHDPPLRRSPQERQTPRPADGIQEIMNQTGNKDGLAGPAEPGHGEAERAVTDQRRQVRQLIERAQIPAVCEGGAPRFLSLA
jgi:hypothetical protein